MKPIRALAVIGFGGRVELDPSLLEHYLPHYRTFISMLHAFHTSKIGIEVYILTRESLRLKQPPAEALSHRVIAVESDNSFSEMLERIDPEYVFFWNGGDQRNLLNICVSQGRMPIFSELGWLPQSGTAAFDFLGVNATSSFSVLSGECNGCSDETAIWREKFLKEKDYSSPSSDIAVSDDFIFSPLQMESDSNIQMHSPYKRMRDFAEAVCMAFPNKKIVFRPHPNQKDVDLGRLPTNALVTNDGSLYYWLRGADLVLGINSTVLIEAVLMHKKVVGLGEGVARGKKVFVTEARRLEEIALSYSHLAVDEKAMDGFIHELRVHRQIYYKDYSDVVRVRQNRVLGRLLSRFEL